MLLCTSFYSSLNQDLRKSLYISKLKKVINREMTSWPLKIALKVPKNAWATEDTNSVIFVQKSFSRCAWMGNFIILKIFSFLTVSISRIQPYCAHHFFSYHEFFCFFLRFLMSLLMCIKMSEIAMCAGGEISCWKLNFLLKITKIIYMYDQDSN